MPPRPVDYNEDVIHISYLGKYLGLSYILKKSRLKVKTEYKIRKTKGWDKGKVTRILEVNKDKINAFFNDHNEYNINTSVQIRLKSQLNDNEEAIIGWGRHLPLVSISKSKVECDECGCLDMAIDYEVGEAFCPKCGLVDPTVMIFDTREEDQ